MKKKFLKLDATEGGGPKIVEEEAPDKNDETKDLISTIGSYSGLGFSIALPIAGGAIIGAYLDSIFKMAPKLTLSLIFLGVFLGIGNIINIINKNKEK